MKILELSDSPIETYQSLAFLLSIVLVHENIKNAYYNKYINLERTCDTNSNTFHITFLDVLWGEYYEDGLAELNIHYIREILKADCCIYMRNILDENNYLLLYDVDEYYLSYSKCYHSIHRVHDTYIYGFYDTHFYVMAYMNGKLSRIKVDVEEVIEALYYRLNDSEDISFCHFRFYDSSNVSIDLRCIRDQLVQYLQGKGISKIHDIYGINTYDIISNYLDYMGENLMCDINYKHFRVLWEHKRIMRERIERLSKMIHIDNSMIETSKEIENSANSLFMLIMKYNLKRNEAIIDRAKNMLFNIKEREVKMITELIELLITLF